MPRQIVDRLPCYQHLGAETVVLLDIHQTAAGYVHLQLEPCVAPHILRDVRGRQHVDKDMLGYRHSNCMLGKKAGRDRMAEVVGYNHNSSAYMGCSPGSSCYWHEQHRLDEVQQERHRSCYLHDETVDLHMVPCWHLRCYHYCQ